MKIKEVIKERGLTSVIVAKRMGVAPEALSQVIHGNPTVQMLERIATAIGCHVTDLFDKPTPTEGVCPHCGGYLVVKIERK